MKVLGISPLDKDATASLVEDGCVLFAAGEERYSRTKQQDGFPYNAIQDALARTNTEVSQLDAVVYPFMAAADEMKIIEGNLEEEKKFVRSFATVGQAEALEAARSRSKPYPEHIHGLESPNERMQKSLLHMAAYRLAGRGPLSKSLALRRSQAWAKAARESFERYETELSRGLDEIGWTGNVKRMEHHVTHAANSYYCSGFDEALCVTIDGYGTGLAGSVSVARGGKIKRLHGLQYPNSLGTLYEHVTSSLGFKPSRHEGKIVGLASYGNPAVLTDVLLGRIEQTPGDFRIFGSNNTYFSRYLASQFSKIDVAAAYQRVLEIVATNYVKHYVQNTGIGKVVLSGGVAANVKLNQRIFEIEGVDQVFIYPNMGDGGCGTGAAIRESIDKMCPSMSDVYYGPEFTDEQMEDALKREHLQFSKPEFLAADVAKLIHEGQVVARFDGRMEYGPRALGNRSILYHAREPEVNQWLNKRLGRTEFMPFAPVTLYEARERYYHNIRGAEHTAEFMTITFDCTDEMKRDCPAAVHVDGTARPQLVRREVNQGYYDIIAEYEKLSGISSLINTSFNMHEEPIVCTPDDAVRAFLQGSLDFLVLGPYLVAHPANERRLAEAE